MSLYDYEASLGLGHPPFYALIMAAMRKADSVNAGRLQRAFPEIWNELQARYDAPGGCLEGEREPTDDPEVVSAVIDLMTTLKESLAKVAKNSGVTP